LNNDYKLNSKIIFDNFGYDLTEGLYYCWGILNLTEGENNYRVYVNDSGRVATTETRRIIYNQEDFRARFVLPTPRDGDILYNDVIRIWMEVNREMLFGSCSLYVNNSLGSKTYKMNFYGYDQKNDISLCYYDLNLTHGTNIFFGEANISQSQAYTTLRQVEYEVPPYEFGFVTPPTRPDGSNIPVKKTKVLVYADTQINSCTFINNADGGQINENMDIFIDGGYNNCYYETSLFPGENNIKVILDNGVANVNLFRTFIQNDNVILTFDSLTPNNNIVVNNDMVMVKLETNVDLSYEDCIVYISDSDGNTWTKKLTSEGYNVVEDMYYCEGEINLTNGENYYYGSLTLNNKTHNTETRRIIYEEPPFEIEFVSPTPTRGSTVSVPQVIIRVIAYTDVDSCSISIDGISNSMSIVDNANYDICEYVAILEPGENIISVEINKNQHQYKL
jgi:hypothetical protein